MADPRNSTNSTISSRIEYVDGEININIEEIFQNLESEQVMLSSSAATNIPDTLPNAALDNRATTAVIVDGFTFAPMIDLFGEIPVHSTEDNSQRLEPEDSKMSENDTNCSTQSMILSADSVEGVLSDKPDVIIFEENKAEPAANSAKSIKPNGEGNSTLNATSNPNATEVAKDEEHAGCVLTDSNFPTVANINIYPRIFIQNATFAGSEEDRSLDSTESYVPTVVAELNTEKSSTVETIVIDDSSSNDVKPISGPIEVIPIDDSNTETEIIYNRRLIEEIQRQVEKFRMQPSTSTQGSDIDQFLKHLKREINMPQTSDIENVFETNDIQEPLDLSKDSSEQNLHSAIKEDPNKTSSDTMPVIDFVDFEKNLVGSNLANSQTLHHGAPSHSSTAIQPSNRQVSPLKNDPEEKKNYFFNLALRHHDGSRPQQEDQSYLKRSAQEKTPACQTKPADVPLNSILKNNNNNNREIAMHEAHNSAPTKSEVTQQSPSRTEPRDSLELNASISKQTNQNMPESEGSARRTETEVVRTKSVLNQKNQNQQTEMITTQKNDPKKLVPINNLEEQNKENVPQSKPIGTQKKQRTGRSNYKTRSPKKPGPSVSKQKKVNEPKSKRKPKGQINNSEEQNKENVPQSKSAQNKQQTDRSKSKTRSTEKPGPLVSKPKKENKQESKRNPKSTACRTATEAKKSNKQRKKTLTSPAHDQKTTSIDDEPIAKRLRSRIPR